METITSEQPTVPADTDRADAQEPVVPRRSPLRAAIKTGRPKEWIKNVFVFAGLLFSGKFNQPHDVLEAVLTFVAFCLISSAGYFVNDLIDVELDRKHPKKRFRPLAAGELSERSAISIAPVLAMVAIAHRLRHRQLAGRPDGGRLRHRPAGLQPRPQAGRDHRRDDAGRPLHPPRRRRRQRRRRPRLGVADPLHRLPGCLPRLHQAPPGGGLRAARGGLEPARARALLAPLPRPDGLPGHHRHRDQLRDLHRQLAADRQPDDADDPARRLRHLPLPVPDLRPLRRPLDGRDRRRATAASRRPAPPTPWSPSCCSTSSTRRAPLRARPPSGRSGRGPAPRRRSGRRRRGGRRSRSWRWRRSTSPGAAPGRRACRAGGRSRSWR